MSLLLDHDERTPSSARVLTSELRRTEAGDLGIFVQAEVDAEQLGERRGFSIGLLKSDYKPGPADGRPLVTFGADAAHFSAAERDAAVEVLRRQFRVGGGRYYQLGDLPPEAVILNFVVATLMGVPPNVLANLVVEALKHLLPNGVRRRPTRFKFGIERGPHGSKVTGVIETDSEAMLRAAAESLRSLAEQEPGVCEFRDGAWQTSGGEATRSSAPPQQSEAAYLRILEAVGREADALGDRHIAAHWPFVGTDYRGLVIAGQALKGWDAETTPARWRAVDAITADGRLRLLAGAQAWATGREEPMGEVLRWDHRSRSPFWGLSRRVVERLEPSGVGPWYGRYTWWNVYPLGWDDRDESPTGLLKDLQTPHVADLFWAVMDELGARRVLLVSGKDWWPAVSDLLGISGLPAGRKPVIAAGHTHGLTLVASYHPGARLAGITRDAFADAVAQAFREKEM